MAALLTPMIIKRIIVTPNELQTLLTKCSCLFFSEFLPPRNLEECHDLIRRLKDENEALKVELLPRTLNECHDLIRRLTAEKETVEARYEALYEKFTQIKILQEAAPTTEQEGDDGPTDQSLANPVLKEMYRKLKNFTLITLSLTVGLYLGSTYVP